MYFKNMLDSKIYCKFVYFEQNNSIYNGRLKNNNEKYYSFYKIYEHFTQ